MHTKFLGTGVAIVTPFNQDLTVDYNALEAIVNSNIENGTNYIVISGTTGESVTVTAEEKAEITKFIINVTNKRVPLVLGIGGNNTQAILTELSTTNFEGVDAILSVAPYYSKPTQEGLYQHFKTVAEASPVPVILYNVPGRTSKNMLPETTLRLARDCDNIFAVKEAGNNMQQYLELIKNKPQDFLIISGDDDLALGVTLAGGAGVISVIGQAFPKDFSKMIQLGLEGKAKEAYALHYKLMDITSMIFEENNPAGIKAVLKALQLCNDTVRLPLLPATADLQQRIKNYVDVY